MDYSKLTEEEIQEILRETYLNPPKPPYEVIRLYSNGTEDRRATIRRLRAEGLTQPKIAQRLGVSVSLVCRVLKGER